MAKSVDEVMYFDNERQGCVVKEVDLWVGDHFGIAVGIKLS